MSDIDIPGIGSLEPRPALEHLDLLAPPVAAALTSLAERGVATASSALVVEIDPEFADKALVPDKEKIPHDFGPMDIQALAVSEECHLLVFTALGHS